MEFVLNKLASSTHLLSEITMLLLCVTSLRYTDAAVAAAAVAAVAGAWQRRG